MSDPYSQAYTYTVTEEKTEEKPTPKILPIIILIVLGIVLFVVIGLLVFGRTTTTIDQTTNGEITLQWRGVFLSEDVINPILDEYKKVKPNVTIEYSNLWPEGLPSENAALSYRKELNRVLSGGNFVEIPDIFMVQNTWAGDYENFSTPSTSISFAEFTESFYPFVTTDFGNNSIVRGVPLWADTFAIIYNEDLILRSGRGTVPLDWDTFYNFAVNNLTTKSGNRITTAGFAGGSSLNTSFGFELANLLMFSNRISISGNDGKLSFATDNKTLSTLEFFKSFENGSWDSFSFENDSSAFLNGEVAMIFIPSYRLREILKYNEQYQLNLKIKVSPVPYVTEEQQVNIATYWGAMVAKESRNSSAAWEFLEWVTQNSQLELLSNNLKAEQGFFGNLFPKKDLKSLLENDEYLKYYNQGLEYAKSWYQVKGIEIKNAFNQLINQPQIRSEDITKLQQTLEQIRLSKGQLTL